MIKAIISKDQFEIEMTDKTSGTINGKPFKIDPDQETETKYHIIKDRVSYNLELLEYESDTKLAVIKVNGKKVKVQLKDQYDELLEKMGISAGGAGKVSSIKAPMPGLVLEIKVKPGIVVKKDDPVVVLEAMKMENILKSPTDGEVAKVNVTKGESVEKNQVLIEFK